MPRGALISPLDRKLAADRRRALRMIAHDPNGCSEYALRMHGFTAEFVMAMVNAGLVFAEHLLIRDHPAEIAHIQLTDAGRAVLEGRKVREAAPRSREHKGKRLGTAAN